MAQRKIKIGTIKKVSGEVNIAGGDLTIYKGYTVKEVSDLLAQITSTTQPKSFDGRCPYKGLDAFEGEDAKLFFGREGLVQELVGRVKESRTVFITGPSGSGKSSLIRAGLIHALKQGAIKSLHSEGWLYETMKPGREPLKDLALAFSRLKSPALADYFQDHANETEVLNKCADSILSGRKNQRFVLFVDQFEEVFTQISNDEERLSFLNMLAYAGTVEYGRVIVLFAMRSDFVSNCATYPTINELLSKEFRQIGAMQPEELVSAIALPAKHVGLPIEDELIARIINDMKGEPGALPLMQFALKELFDSQQAKGGVIALRLQDYLKHGGIHKSLERHADNSFAKLGEDEQQLARSIFGGLIEIGRGTQDTRRTALFDELIPANTKAGDVEAVVQKLADARLIITDEQAGKDTVTISHEKLIDAWPWLKRLVNENRDAIALQNEIASDAKEWDDHNRDESYLYIGARLANAREKLKAKTLILNDLAQTFLNKCVEIEEAERLKEEARRQKELDDARRLANAERERAQEQMQSATKLRRQARYLIVALAATLLAATVAVFFAIQSQEQTKIARVGELAAMTVNLRDTDPVVSLLMGIEGFRLQSNLRTRSVLIDNLNWNPQVLQYFSGQSQILEGVAFSPDGNLLASAGYDKAITLWDLQKRQQVGILQSETPSIVWSIAFSPDGKILASGHHDHTIILWDVKTLQPIGEPLQGHADIVRSITFSPDGSLLASASADHTIMVWDVTAHQSIGQPLVEHSDEIYSIAFSPDGKALASGSKDGTVILWDIRAHSPIGEPFMGHTGWVKSVAFSPDGKIIASGGVDNTILLWDVKTHRQIGELMTTHSGEVRSVAFSPDGKMLASGSADKTIILWDLETQLPIGKPFAGHTERVVSIGFHPDGKTLASVGDDGLTILWDTRARLPMGQTLAFHQNSVTSVAFSPDGKLLASASNDQSILILDSSTRQKIGNPITGISKRVASIAFAPDNKILAAGYADGMIILWDVATHEAIGTPLIKQVTNITNVVFSPDGKTLASASIDNTIVLWDVQTRTPIGSPLMGHSAPVWSIAFSPDGLTLASGGADDRIILWDLQNQKPRGSPLVGHSNRINSLAFSPDGKILAAGGFDNTIISWNVQTREPLGAPLVGHLKSINSIAFSPDGTTLASGSADNTIILWDFLALQPIGLPLEGDSSSITSLAFSPDGKSLASGSTKGSVILWDLDPESWIQKTCQRVSRNFSRSEWKKYFPYEDYHTTCVQWPSGK